MCANIAGFSINANSCRPTRVHRNGATFPLNAHTMRVRQGGWAECWSNASDTFCKSKIVWNGQQNVRSGAKKIDKLINNQTMKLNEYIAEQKIDPLCVQPRNAAFSDVWPPSVIKRISTTAKNLIGAPLVRRKCSGGANRFHGSLASFG